MKKHVIKVSSKFLKGHPRAGQETRFPSKIINKTKKHTLRLNYKYWKKIIDEVNEGLAELHVRTWSGLPYKSSQEEVKIFRKGEVGIQECNVYAKFEYVTLTNSLHAIKNIEMNDGLSERNFWDWFTKDADNVAIIHFTKMRY